MYPSINNTLQAMFAISDQMLLDLIKYLKPWLLDIINNKNNGIR